MTIKVDGTNGVLQAYDYQVLTTGFSYTFAAGTQTLVINPAGTLATGTITMPASPVDGMTITFSSTKQITALTVSGNSGQSIVSAPTILPANQATSYVYRLASTTWFPIQTVPTNIPVTGGGSAITSSTAVASTSGTAIDFTGIPSWVKRITVMFNGVSTSGTSDPLIQLGTSGGIVSTGYDAGGSSITSGVASRSSTAGFLTRNVGGAAALTNGLLTITLVSSGVWAASGVMNQGANTLTWAGVVTGVGTVDRVRCTWANGTDTFDAGSINILYE